MLANAVLVVNLAALRANVRQIRKEIGPRVRLIPVLKGDAYGLGARMVAKTLASMDGIDTFALAHAAEGIALRQAGFSQKMLLLSMPPEAHLSAAIRADLTLPLARLDQFPVLKALAMSEGRPVPVSLVLDTGLHRLGFDISEAEALCSALRASEEFISPVGTYSHFAGRGPNFSRAQEALFHRFVDQIRAAGIDPGPLHMSSSASLEEGLALDQDAVRIGRRLFLDAPERSDGPIREVCSLRAFLTDVRPRKAGDAIGYGGKVVLPKDTRVGVISIGYGDGLDPALAEAHAPVLIRGVRVPLLSCCMDQSLLDLGALPAAPGDSVTLFGPDENGILLSAQESAGLIGCEGVDLTARLTPRVARVYEGE